jgi:hypothetical protein
MKETKVKTVYSIYVEYLVVIPSPVAFLWTEYILGYILLLFKTFFVIGFFLNGSFTSKRRTRG